MRLGFVGVGKHAQRMAAAFRECGAEIVCFDRGTGDPRDLVRDPLFGSRMPWASQVLAPGVDAIICCAPPVVTRKVAAECLIAAKRCMATKPLLWSEVPIHLDEASVADSCIYVDTWRLYSPAWLALKANLQDKEIRSVHVDFYGNGPVRETHSGLLDYGPHALAFALDLGLKHELSWKLGEEDTFRGQRKQWVATGERLSVVTGNCGAGPMMRVRVDTTVGSLFWDEIGDSQIYSRSHISPEMSVRAFAQNHRDIALRNFCRAFIAGEPSDTLRISCETMKLLRQAEPW